MGLPSCQEHLLGASGLTQRRSLVSLSPGGLCSTLLVSERAPEGWGHPAGHSSARGVSEGMLRSVRGDRCPPAAEKAAEKHDLLEWGAGLGVPLGTPGGAGLPPLT